MRVLLLCLCILIASCQIHELRVLRNNNGTATIKNFKFSNIEGAFMYVKAYNGEQATYYGVDKATMTPFFIMAYFKDRLSGGNELPQFTCGLGEWQRENTIDLSGPINLTGSWDKAGIKANCIAVNGEHWNLEVEVTESKTFFFPDKEAGMRAKNLLGISNERYRPFEVINYATFGSPYSSTLESCAVFIGENYPEISQPEPGAIILGQDFDHCGIIDNEGSKFIHSNPIKKQVTQDSIVMLKQYFPRGVIYKKCSKNPTPFH